MQLFFHVLPNIEKYNSGNSNSETYFPEYFLQELIFRQTNGDFVWKEIANKVAG